MSPVLSSSVVKEIINRAFSYLDLLDENWEYLDSSSQENSLQLETNQSIDGGGLSNRKGSVSIYF